MIDYDFCEVPPASLAGVVYVDLQRNCRLDAGEPRLPGVTVRLLDREGNVLAHRAHRRAGRYRFEDLRPGEYAVLQEQPAGYFQGGQQAGSHGGDARRSTT